MKQLGNQFEVLTSPAIIFCDEPTSGLDSFMSLQVVNAMKCLAKLGMTVITTIHQPSSQVFTLFDEFVCTFILKFIDTETYFISCAQT